MPIARVLRPPGGGSSIFFGGDPPPTKPAARPPTNKPAEPQTKAAESHQQTAGRVQKEPVSSTTAPSQQQPMNVGKANTSVHTSSKVLNPPGGRSNFSLGWS